MSVYYDKFGLNTYYGTPYFAAHLPAGYPLSPTLQKCRAFRRLPSNLRELAEKSKQWAIKNGWKPHGIDQWYDPQGYELNPVTGKRLTDAQIDAEWDTYHPDLGLDDFTVHDIPAPSGGFPDPGTWQPPEETQEEPEDDDAPSIEKILEDIQDRGWERALEEYGPDNLRRVTGRTS